MKEIECCVCLHRLRPPILMCEKSVSYSTYNNLKCIYDINQSVVKISSVENPTQLVKVLNFILRAPHL